jgi:hypothetical protein
MQEPKIRVSLYPLTICVKATIYNLCAIACYYFTPNIYLSFTLHRQITWENFLAQCLRGPVFRARRWYCIWLLTIETAGEGSRQRGPWVAKTSWLSKVSLSSAFHSPLAVNKFTSHRRLCTTGKQSQLTLLIVKLKGTWWSWCKTMYSHLEHSGFHPISDLCADFSAHRLKLSPQTKIKAKSHHESEST